MNILVNVIAACAIVLGQQCLVLGEIPEDTFTNCGGVFEESTGVLSTPNFPGPYPTPIYCEWLVHAPPGKKIVLYFTQNYMRDSIYLFLYEYYQDINVYVGREELGQIFWEHDLTFLVVYKPYVLIQFSVESIANRHLRVIDHLLDVYGFNITYEFVDAQDSLPKQTCSVKTCSYLGNCLASADFSNYSCQCFDKFFGDSCQYGPFCDPSNGINLCSNGGQCKYFFGSLINQCECPDGFEGAYCEMPSGKANGSIASTECGALKCSHSCKTDFMGQLHCYCPEGYTMGNDNETCAHIDRYRFDVAVEFQGTIRIPHVNKVAIMKEKIIDTLKSNGIRTAANLEIHGFRNTSGATIMEFHFYCFASEVSSVPSALKSLVDQGDLAGYPLKKTQPNYDKNPELALSEVINYDPHATLRGKMLTLVCAAKGSSKMVFRWFKDNVRVDTSLTTRNAWETLVPHTVHGMLLSVLNIDSVMPIDQGVFTCKVEDFGNIVEGNVAVTVNNYPRVQLDPMSLSVHKGKTITFKCISPDDSWQQFTYEWYKNGMKISANSKGEYAEDMYPTGVRLVVTEVKQNTEYTCKVTNEAGPANVSAFVFVITDNSTVQFCPRSYVGEVMWSNTSGGHFDVKRCPTEQGGEYTQLGTIDYGYARRQCECDSNARNCKWAEPNFSKCQSLQLIRTYDELELLRNGYQQTNLSDIFDDLHTFMLLKNENAILYSGDMDMVAGILKELVIHMKTFPQLVKRDKKRIEAKRLVDLMGAVLTRSSMATADEKSEIMVGPSIVLTVHHLITGAIEELSFSSPLQESSSEFDMREEYLTEVPCLTCDTDYTWNMQKTETASDMKLKAYTIRSKYLADLLSYRNQINSINTRLEFTPASGVYSVADINEDITNFGNPTARIVINHDTDILVARSNTTVCLKWQFEIRNSFSGRWTRDDCITIESHRDKTVCDCKLPGHFIAGMIPSNVSDISQIHLAKQISVPLLCGYCVSLVFILVAFFIYMRTYSHLNIEIHIVYLSFVISILLATVFRFVCLTYTTASESINQFLGWGLTFSYYVALTSLCLEMFHLFVITYNIKLIRLTRFKFFLLCWGLPLVLMIPTTLVSKFLDLNKPFSCHALCWLYIDTSEFLVFVFIIGLEFCIYILLLILCICSLRKWTEEWRYAEKRTYVKSIVKNSILLIFLILTMCSGIDLEPWSDKPQVACNITFQLILCILVLILRCILNKHIRFLYVRMCFGTPRRESNSKDVVESKSFRAFVEPKNVSNVFISQEEDNVSKYYDEVNRTKYTKERKKMLSSLLGSGSGSGSGGSTAEMTVSYNSSSEGSKESTSPSVQLMDLFTHSGTDCGILINDCSKSTSSVGASGSVKDDIQPTIEISDTNYNLEKEKRRQAENLKCSMSDISTDIRVQIKNVHPVLEVHSHALNKLSFTHIDHDFGNQVTQTDHGDNIKTEVLPRILQSETKDIHMTNCQRKRLSSGLLNLSPEVEIDIAFNDEQLQNNSDCESESNSESNLNDEELKLVANSVDSSDREDGDSSCSSKLLSSES